MGLCLLSLVGSGCAGSLRLTLVAAATRPPGNVALFFSASDERGEPLLDLKASDFQLFEDGEPLSSARAQLTLFDPKRAAEHYTLLLVDLNASVMTSEQANVLVAGVQQLVGELAPYQRVALYAFDGAKALYELVPFSGSAAQAGARLRERKARDPSTNLNGAVLLALAELERALQYSDAPHRFGNLVVFTDGTDRANRTPYRQMFDAIDATSMHVFTIGVGRELNDSVLSRVGKTGYLRVEENAAFRAAINEIAGHLLGAARHYYLLGYCSQSRGGEHVIELQALARGRRGTLKTRIHASGFGPGCKASNLPPFATTPPSSLLRRRLSPAPSKADAID